MCIFTRIKHGWFYQLAINVVFDMLMPKEDTEQVKVGVIKSERTFGKEKVGVKTDAKV